MAEGTRERGETLRGALAKLADAMLGLLRTRLELVAVEYTEERDRITRQVALLLVGLACLLFALFFGAFAIIAYYWDTYRITAILGVAGVFVAWGRPPVAARGSVEHLAGAVRRQRRRAREGSRGHRADDEAASDREHGSRPLRAQGAARRAVGSASACRRCSRGTPRGGSSHRLHRRSAAARRGPSRRADRPRGAVVRRRPHARRDAYAVDDRYGAACVAGMARRD